MWICGTVDNGEKVPGGVVAGVVDMLNGCCAKHCGGASGGA